MQSSVRAVEAYRRSRLIDGVTTDEDKIAAVYRLEEICQVLRTSPLDIVREMLDYTLKRLEHKSPIVKQKTLRFIKYAAGKGGAEFKREIQRQAGVIRSLFHYRGQVDALKGDALNKSVRDTAREAIAAIFGSEDKPATMEDVGKRIQGFGSSNYDSKPREEEKKSVLSGLVGFGSQSIRQSIELINTYNNYSGSGSGGSRSSLSGSYRAQGLRRSLTSEREKPFENEDGMRWSVRDAEADVVRSDTSPDDKSLSKAGVSNGRAGPNERAGETVEDRLLDSLTTPGGVRLQPSRETLQAFITTAQKLDAGHLVNSLETKMKAHSWQVRFKALCLLEASIRERENNRVLDSVTAMFEEDASVIVDSLQSPQASLREKAKKVLDMLGGVKDHTEDQSGSDKSSGVPTVAVADLPDLMDTRDLDFDFETDSLESASTAPKLDPPPAPTNVVAPPVQHDFFGDWLDEGSRKEPAKDLEADPFAGVSFHSSDTPVGNGAEPDLFSGLDLDSSSKVENGAVGGLSNVDGSSLFDGLSVTQAENPVVSQDDLLNLMGNLSTGPPANAKNVGVTLQNLSSTNLTVQQAVPVVPSNLSSGVNMPNFFLTPQPQGIGVSAGVFPPPGVSPQVVLFPPGGAQYTFPTGIPGAFPPHVMFHQALASGARNFTGMNATYAQHLGASFASVPMYGGSLQTNNANGGGLNQNYGDNFDFSSDPSAQYSTAVNTKKEDTKAFDFISDHISSQLGPKKSR